MICLDYKREQLTGVSDIVPFDNREQQSSPTCSISKKKQKNTFLSKDNVSSNQN